MTVVTALIVAATQGGWGWLQREIYGPPGLKAYAPGVSGCAPRYFDASLEQMRQRAELIDTGEAGGVYIPTSDYPAAVIATLQAKTTQAIVVREAKVSVLSRGSLPRKGSVLDPGGCGAGIDERVFDVNFSHEPVSVKPHVQRTAQGDVRKGRDFPFKVSADDPEQFVFELKNVRRDVRFVIVLSWVSEGEPGTTRLDNGGRGYRVMGMPEKVPHYAPPDLVSEKPSLAR